MCVSRQGGPAEQVQILNGTNDQGFLEGHIGSVARGFVLD